MPVRPIIRAEFNYLKSKGHYVSGYVIMPNHVHAVIGFRKTNEPINTIIGNGKRFIAYEIINRLKVKDEAELLSKLSLGVDESRKIDNKKHEVWELSFDWKRCESADFIIQKLNYFHMNPCKGKWNLCASPVDYLHSSAKFYATGEQGVYEVIGYGLLMDIDFTLDWAEDMGK